MSALVHGFVIWLHELTLHCEFRTEQSLSEHDEARIVNAIYDGHLLDIIGHL